MHMVGKLDGQDAGEVHRGRKLSDSGAKARFFHEVAETHLSKIIKVDLKSDLFTYDIDAQALARAQMMDGKLLLVTNMADFKPVDIVNRYKSLADIERGFKVLKSEIEIAPVFHRLPERIRAHASICFIALILHRVMTSASRLPATVHRPRLSWYNCGGFSAKASRSTKGCRSLVSPPSTATRPPCWPH